VAQVNGRNALTWDEKFELDVWYVDNWSLWLDACILGRTVWQVLRREGISHEGQATMTEFMGSSGRPGTYTGRPNDERLPLFVYGASGHGKVVADAASPAIASPSEASWTTTRFVTARSC